MTRSRRLLLSAFFLTVIAGQLYDVVLEREDWPFSSYPMYSSPRASRLTRTELVGVGRNGEFLLTPERHFPPLDNTRFQRAMQLIRRRPDAEARQAAAIDVLMRRYESARRAGYHDDPPLLALRTYDVTWTLESGARNRDDPGVRTLRLEITVPQASAEAH